MNITRVSVLIGKEFQEFRRNLAAFVPVLAVGVAALFPFLLALVLPAVLDQGLADDGEFEQGVALMGRYMPAVLDLEPEAAAQAFLFQLFILFFVLIPVSGAMSLAAYSIVGEKQGRTLEPLLATPLTTTELLAAKTLAAALPAFAIEFGALALYLGGIWWLAEPGVLGVLLSLRTLLIVLVVGPLAAIAGLQLAVIVSSRVNDPRSAQQIGVLIILPILGLVIAQLTGAFFLTIGALVAIAGALAIMVVGLTAVGVVLFERETVLTRWK